MNATAMAAVGHETLYLRDGGLNLRAVFALSTGRCGTMTLAKLLNAHPAIVGLHEPLPRLIELSGEAYAAPFAEWACFAIDVARRDYIQESNRQNKIYAETANRLTFFAYAIERVFPGTRFIHLVRNPCDVIESGVRRGWYQGHPWDVGRIAPRKPPWSIRWASLSPSQRVAWNWVETNRFIIDFLSTIPPERKMFLQLEKLADQQEDLWSFLKVSPIVAPVEVTNKGTDIPINRDYVDFLLSTGKDVLTACGYWGESLKAEMLGEGV